MNIYRLAQRGTISPKPGQGTPNNTHPAQSPSEHTPTPQKGTQRCNRS